MVEGPLKFREPKILNFTNSYNIFQAHSYSPRGRIKVMREIALNKLLFLFRLSKTWKLYTGIRTVYRYTNLYTGIPRFASFGFYTFL